ncbi:uncharacterized protein LOC102656349 isoform X2 [Apis mellifera]|uniref:Uncharacterized protein LOC102656349 isoform X2 n=1 Tax=Apis mellifera TaxID=7460 RepID=A0A7M7MVS1_APIME|nr:uncharacterized protein LOC102656349 isoform X2 [Apis mellifera]|eukprot:XP_026301571.1 uncharacterized protein LOC102656349 isoform X2 [Apis mellifera]
MAGLPRICDIERQKWCCNSDLLLNIRVLAGNRVQCPKVTGSEFIDRSRMRGMSVSTLSKIRRSSIQWNSFHRGTIERKEAGYFCGTDRSRSCKTRDVMGQVETRA